ncbi:MAG TPA: membrane protein insertion efficiency factor YidD [Cyclobacteriaceae bacterium]|nr:membrane protein insertion efficiency factor YidD [Cyclobacteriaceae bacterium]
MRSLLVFFFILSGYLINAQSFQNDLEVIQTATEQSDQPTTRKKRTINPFGILYNTTLNFYQKHISAQLDANCAFETTCSRFSRLMVKDLGLFKGYFLTFDRLGRCNHISVVESHPIRINAEGKIIESTSHLSIRK